MKISTRGWYDKGIYLEHDCFLSFLMSFNCSKCKKIFFFSFRFVDTDNDRKCYPYFTQNHVLWNIFHAWIWHKKADRKKWFYHVVLYQHSYIWKLNIKHCSFFPFHFGNRAFKKNGCVRDACFWIYLTDFITLICISTENGMYFFCVTRNGG